MTQQSRNSGLSRPDSAVYLSALALDLYELTMAPSYVDEAMHASATFGLFVRDLPPERGYLVNPGAYRVQFTAALLALRRKLADGLGGSRPASSAAGAR